MIEIPDEFLNWLRVDARHRRDGLRVQLHRHIAVRGAGRFDEAAIRRELERANRLCDLLDVVDSAQAA